MRCEDTAEAHNDDANAAYDDYGQSSLICILTHRTSPCRVDSGSRGQTLEGEPLSG